MTTSVQHEVFLDGFTIASLRRLDETFVSLCLFDMLLITMFQLGVSPYDFNLSCEESTVTVYF